jgi:hypothetical protein
VIDLDIDVVMDVIQNFFWYEDLVETDKSPRRYQEPCKIYFKFIPDEVMEKDRH